MWGGKNTNKRTNQESNVRAFVEIWVIGLIKKALNTELNDFPNEWKGTDYSYCRMSIMCVYHPNEYLPSLIKQINNEQKGETISINHAMQL